MFGKLVPFPGSWVNENFAHRTWKPFSYQKLELEFPEASDYSSLPSRARFLGYDPYSDECEVVVDDAPAEGSLLAFLLSTAFGTVLGIYGLRSLLLRPWRNMFRQMLTTILGSAPASIHNFRRMRKVFNSTEFFDAVEVKRHSHGKSAGNRRAATRFIAALCTFTGLEQYCFQMSSSDQSEDRRGERTYYWAKDVSALPQFDEIRRSDFVSMVDVDYYVDMPKHLADAPQPHVLYTVVPETAGRVTEDYRYHFSLDGNVNFSVNGGATYSHMLWNYSTDWFTTTSWFWFLPYKTVVYDVQSKRVTPDKQVILLSPMRVTYGLAAAIAWFIGRPLARLNPVVGGFAKIVTRTSADRFVSVARLGHSVSCTVPSTIFESLISTRNISPQQKVNNYQVKSHLAALKDVNKDVESPILTDYLLNAPDRQTDDVCVIAMPKLTEVHFTVPDPTDKPCLEAFGEPFVPPAFVPMNNQSASDQSIKGRVLLPREQAEEILGGFKMTPTKQEAVGKFLEFLIPEPGKGIPYDFDVIAERQEKPGQKKDLQDAGLMGAIKRIVTTFQKREAYGKPTDPRNITTFPARQKIEYAAYMYAVMDYMKLFPFYAFGRTPKEVAERIAEICVLSASMVCPDISRMDGFVNEFCRMIERAFGCRFFSAEFVDEFVAAHETSYGNKGVTATGLRYDQEFSRGSGEMGTSVWNTLINLFILFYAKYLECHDYDVAWKWLLDKVMAGGDDGAAGDIDPELLIRAARDVGFILKCPSYQRGDTGVNFLARVYGPGVWEGDPNSMCSLKRQMEKIHLTTTVALPPKQKLYEKALSFALTDSETPVIGSYCKSVLRLTPGFVDSGKLARYGDHWDKAVQYPNVRAEWMWEVAKDEMPLVLVEDLDAWFCAVTSLDQILAPEKFYETGREFTYDEWDPEPGKVLSRTLAVLKVAPSVKRQKPAPKSKPKPRAEENRSQPEETEKPREGEQA